MRAVTLQFIFYFFIFGREIAGVLRRQGRLVRGAQQTTTPGPPPELTSVLSRAAETKYRMPPGQPLLFASHHGY